MPSSGWETVPSSVASDSVTPVAGRVSVAAGSGSSVHAAPASTRPAMAMTPTVRRPLSPRITGECITQLAGSRRTPRRRPPTSRCDYGAGMSDASAATITGIHHFSPTVSDVEASASWYERVFSMTRVPITFAHHEREETGYAVLLMDPVSGLVIGLHHNEANAGRAVRRGPHRSRSHRVQGPQPGEPRRLGDQARRSRRGALRHP